MTASTNHNYQTFRKRAKRIATGRIQTCILPGNDKSLIKTSVCLALVNYEIIIILHFHNSLLYSDERWRCVPRDARGGHHQRVDGPHLPEHHAGAHHHKRRQRPQDEDTEVQLS